MATKSQRPAVFKSTFQEIICVMTLSAATLMSSMSTGCVQIALPRIGRYFDVGGGKLTWIVAPSSLTSGSFLLLFGALSDILGRKRVLVFSYGWFALWSLAVGFAKDDIMFDVFRGFSGIGTAAAIPAAVGILGSSYSQGVRKNKVFACFSGANPLGYVIGLITGGIATEYIGWRSNLFFLTIIYTIFTILAVKFVPSDQTRLIHSKDVDAESNVDQVKPSTLSSLKDLDYVGAGLITLGFGTLVFSLTQAGNAAKGWSTPYIIATLIVSVALIGVFVLWEWFMKERALMPLSIWKYPNFALIMIIISLAFMDFGGVLLFYTTLWFQEINKASPLLTTACFCPQAIAGILVNVFAAYTLHIIPGRILLTIGLLSFTGSALLFALQSVNTLYWAMTFPSLVLSVIGADLSYMVCNLFVSASVPSKLQSTAGGIFNTVIPLGSTLGLGAGAAIVDSVQVKGIRPGETSEEFLVRSFHAGFWFAVGTAGLGFFLTLFVRVGRQGHDKEKPSESGNRSGSDDSIKMEEAAKVTNGPEVAMDKEVEGTV